MRVHAVKDAASDQSGHQKSLKRRTNPLRIVLGDIRWPPNEPEIRLKATDGGFRVVQDYGHVVLSVAVELQRA